jgi:hypothetical protein
VQLTLSVRVRGRVCPKIKIGVKSRVRVRLRVRISLKIKIGIKFRVRAEVASMVAQSSKNVRDGARVRVRVIVSVRGRVMDRVRVSMRVRVRVSSNSNLEGMIKMLEILCIQLSCSLGGRVVVILGLGERGREREKVRIKSSCNKIVYYKVLIQTLTQTQTLTYSAVRTGRAW